RSRAGGVPYVRCIGQPPIAPPGEPGIPPRYRRKSRRADRANPRAPALSDQLRGPETSRPDLIAPGAGSKIDSGHALNARLIAGIEARHKGAVEINHPEHLAIPDQRHHEFGARRGVADDMIGKVVDIPDQDRRALLDRRTAYPTPDGDAHTGRLALEGPQDKFV